MGACCFFQPAVINFSLFCLAGLPVGVAVGRQLCVGPSARVSSACMGCVALPWVRRRWVVLFLFPSGPVLTLCERVPSA